MLAAGRAFSQTQATAAPAAGVGLPLSRKALVKQSGSKSAYKFPTSEAKQTKYLNSLTALLSLTPTQQLQAATIFANATSVQASVHVNLKAGRKALKDAVKSYDTGGISQASAALGALTIQHISNGALAHAAFYQILTPDQQSTMSKLLG
jgi:Spy/CpxP family protein refolding chaperone